MSAWFARVGLPRRMTLIVCGTMVPISCCWVIVIVCGRAVVVIRVIVPDVFVDVQRRRRGGRHNQTLSEKKCDQAAHGSSVLRPARRLGRRAGSAVGVGGSATVASKSPPSVLHDENPDHACHDRQGQVTANGKAKERDMRGDQRQHDPCAPVNSMSLHRVTPQLPRARSGGC